MRTIEIGLAHAREEFRALALEAVVPARTGRATGGRHFGREIEEHRSVGTEGAERPVFQRFHFLSGESLAAHLIGVGRIREAVGEHPGPAREGRTDLRFGVLGTGRKEEERLRSRRHVVGEQEAADLFAKRRSARLARHEHAFALLLQTSGEPFDLRRLAGAVDAFKGDEEGTESHLESFVLLRWFLFRMKRRTARLCSASVRENSLVPSPRATK